MENSNLSRSKHNEHLGVNKIGKNIRKSPLHQPNFGNTNTNRPQPQPQVYNISKNDFRNIVQQLTGSPSHESLPRPTHNPPKPPSMRLQKIRPPPLMPMNNRPPHMPSQAPHRIPPPGPVPPSAQAPYHNSYGRPPQFNQPSPTPMQPGDSGWSNTAESPISAYMRYLQNSIMDSDSRQPQGQPQLHPQGPGQVQSQPSPWSGLLPSPTFPPLASPRMNGAGPALLPSPTSQFLLPSPSGFMNMPSPRSPYPLFSPSSQFPPPLTPNFPFSPMSGLLGPGPQPPPPSPGILFPLSPSGYFPMSSPRWRNQ